MKTLKVIEGVKNLVKVTKANPHIALAGAAVIGVAGVAVSGYLAGKKACTMLKAEELAKGEPLNKKEKAIIIGKCAWVTALIAVLTGAAIIGSTHLANKHIKKLAMMYSTTAAMLEAHQTAEVAKLGTEVVNEIKDEVIKEKNLPEKTTLNTTENGIRGKGDYLFFDDFSGRYFYSNVDKVEAAFVKCSKMLLEAMDGSVSVNDLYDALDMEPCGAGNAWGWDLECDNNNIKDYIFYETYATEAPGGEPCIVLVYHPLQTFPF